MSTPHCGTACRAQLGVPLGSDMSWDFVLVDMGICGGRSIAGRSEDDRLGGIDVLCSDTPPPWDFLEGFAEADDGRRYAWEISILSTYLDPSAWGAGETVERYDSLPMPGTMDLYVTASEVSLILVDRPSFGNELLDLLQDSPPALRPRWLWPVLTEVEQDWLDEMEAAMSATSSRLRWPPWPLSTVSPSGSRPSRHLLLPSFS